MTIQEVFRPDVKPCSANTDLAAAAKIMWDCDCGTVPVVNEEGRVVGMLTDRDICIAAATRAVSPASVRVGDVMSTHVYTCRRDDDVLVALNKMREQRVRRLPVVDQQQKLVGILSISDLAAHAECRRGAEVPGEELLNTLKAISAHSRPALAV